MANYYAIIPSFHSDELTHYGVLGMKWGVRKSKYGMTKRKVKKALKRGGEKNKDDMIDTYRNETDRDKIYNELGKKATQIAKTINKLENEEFRRYQKEDPPYEFEPSSKVKSLYKEHLKLSDQMDKRLTQISRKYVDSFNEATLKDIGWSGDKDKGLEMLKEYGLDYKIRPDGFLYRNSPYRIIDPDDGYIHSRNM